MSLKDFHAGSFKRWRPPEPQRFLIADPVWIRREGNQTRATCTSMGCSSTTTTTIGIDKKSADRIFRDCSARDRLYANKTTPRSCLHLVKLVKSSGRLLSLRCRPPEHRFGSRFPCIGLFVNVAKPVCVSVSGRGRPPRAREMSRAMVRVSRICRAHGEAAAARRLPEASHD